MRHMRSRRRMEKIKKNHTNTPTSTHNAVLHNARRINCANGSHMCLRFHRLECGRIDIEQLHTVRRWHGDIKSIHFIGSDTAVLYDGLRDGHGEGVKGNAWSASVYMEMVGLATIHRHNDCLHHKR